MGLLRQEGVRMEPLVSSCYRMRRTYVRTVRQGKAELGDGDRVLTTLFGPLDSFMFDVTS